MNFLTVKEVAERIKAKPSTIYAWAEQRMIPCFKINGLLRFSEDEVIEWIKSHCIKPAEGYNKVTGRRPGKEGIKNGPV